MRRRIEKIKARIINARMIPILLLIVITGISIGYSAFVSEINISGIVTEVRLKKDVRITGVSKVTETQVLGDNILDNHSAYASTSTDLTRGSLEGAVITDEYIDITRQTAYDYVLIPVHLEAGKTYRLYYEYQVYDRPAGSTGNTTIGLGITGIESVVGRAIRANTTSTDVFTYEVTQSRNANIRVFANYGSAVPAKVKFKVKLQEVISNDGEVSYIEHGVDEIETTVELRDSDSAVAYNIEVTNIGNVEVGILRVNGLPNNLDYEFVGYTEKEKICNSNNECKNGITKDIRLIIRYKEGYYDSNNTEFTINPVLDFEPYYTITYTLETLQLLDSVDVSDTTDLNKITAYSDGNGNIYIYI